MSFVHILVLILFVWVLGSGWLILYIGHRLRVMEIELKIAKTEAGYPPSLVDEDQ